MLLTLSDNAILKFGPLISNVTTDGATTSGVNTIENAKGSATLVITHNKSLVVILLGSGLSKLTIT